MISTSSLSAAGGQPGSHCPILSSRSGPGRRREAPQCLHTPRWRGIASSRRTSAIHLRNPAASIWGGGSQSRRRQAAYMVTNGPHMDDPAGCCGRRWCSMTHGPALRRVSHDVSSRVTKERCCCPYVWRGSRRRALFCRGKISTSSQCKGT